MAHDSHRWTSVFYAAAETLAHTGVWQPGVDVYRTRTGWLVKVDLAGVLPEDVKLAIDGPCLTIRGVRRDCNVQEGCRHYSMEISYSRFERTIELPEPIEPAEVTPDFWRGFLLVRIDREEGR
jgi:HSP20 family protein